MGLCLHFLVTPSLLHGPWGPGSCLPFQELCWLVSTCLPVIPPDQETSQPFPRAYVPLMGWVGRGRKEEKWQSQKLVIWGQNDAGKEEQQQVGFFCEGGGVGNETEPAGSIGSIRAKLPEASRLFVCLFVLKVTLGKVSITIVWENYWQ